MEVAGRMTKDNMEYSVNKLSTKINTENFLKNCFTFAKQME